jgi:3-hydroxymyristoyl/3-hydroxydecanoyl-(acyl carrier protein) dehydratase
VNFRLSETGDAGRFQIEIPAASALFAGHFPGQPILPGIAHLAIVAGAAGAPLAAVRGFRVRRPVEPGESLDLSLGPPDPDGWRRFEIRRGDAAVAGGSVQTASEGEEPAPETAPLPALGDLPFLPVVLPHNAPARLVLGVLTAAAEEIACAAEIPADHPLVSAWLALACLGIEAAAQAAAVLEALTRRDDDPGPRVGYLVGIRDARFAVPFLPAGQAFQVTARLTGSAPPLSIYEITADGGVRATISTFIRGG